MLEKVGIAHVGHCLDNKGNYNIDKIKTYFVAARVPFRRAHVIRILQRVKESVLPRWGNLLSGASSGEDLGEEPPLDFTLTTGRGTVRLADTTTKSLYRVLLAGVFRRPAAELTWTHTFPTHDTASIWANTFNWYTSPKVSNADFKLKHRIIFTCAQLHRIYPEEYGAGCAVCGGPYEDLLHLAISCPVVSHFWTRLEDLIARRLNLRLPPPAAHVRDPRGSWHLLFGTPEQPGVNTAAVNLILSLARYTIFVVRNIHLHDRKTADHWSVFKGLLRTHITHLLAYSKDRLLDFFQPNNSLITVMQNGSLEFSF